MVRANLAASLLVMLALVLGAGQARSETVNCTPVTTVPAVITSSGVYCLTGDLGTTMVSGSAIEIQTNNVVLDLNGFKLGGLGAGSSTAAWGISAADRKNITIKNGTVRGFYQGITLGPVGSSASQGHVVEGIRAEQNWAVAIFAEGSGNIIRNNLVVETGGSTLSGQPDVSAVGIHVGGAGPRVLNNDVINTFKQGAGTAKGISLSIAIGGLAVGNRITQADQGIVYDQFSSGKYRDNLTLGVTTPFSGGTAVGTNN